MNIVFNKKKIAETIMDLSSAVEIPLVLYDGDLNTVASSGKFSPFCGALRKIPECDEDCSACDLKYLRRAVETKSAVTYSCQAGVYEKIQPIFYENEIVAFIQIGQILDEKGEYSSKDKLEEYLSISNIKSDAKKNLLRLYEKLPKISDNRLIALLNVIETIIQSLIYNGFITSDVSEKTRRIEKYIKENLTEDFKTEELCKKFFISKSTLYRSFRTEFGTSVNEYVIAKRLDLAKKMLTSKKQLSVSQVSAKCGFTDYNYFIRAFKKRCGITPLQFKKSIL